MAGKVFGEASRNVRICVDSYESRILSGRAHYARLPEEPWTFSSAMQLLIRLDSLMDETNFPQSFTNKHSFSALAGRSEPSKVDETSLTGELATFNVRVIFRQHSSWQGEVTWLEGEGSETFRSVLELLILIDSALGLNQ